MSRLNRSPDPHGNINAVVPVAPCATTVRTPPVLHSRKKLRVQFGHEGLGEVLENLNDRHSGRREYFKLNIIAVSVKFQEMQKVRRLLKITLLRGATLLSLGNILQAGNGYSKFITGDRTHVATRSLLRHRRSL